MPKSTNVRIVNLQAAINLIQVISKIILNVLMLVVNSK